MYGNSGVSLLSFMQYKCDLSPSHLMSFKNLLGKGIRSQRKREALARLNLTTLRLKKAKTYIF